jgi:hypothetical protein
MYLIGAALIGIQTALGFGVGIYGIVAYLAGVAANAKSQYVLMAMRRLDNADALGLVGEKRQQYLREAGGVSLVAGVLAGVLVLTHFALVVFGTYLIYADR